MLESMAGIPHLVGIPVLGLISTIYTAIGGYQAVIWSDVFQAVVIFVGLVLLNILGTVSVGSVKEVSQIYYDYGRLDLKWDASSVVRSTVWGFFFGTFVNIFALFGISQMAVQRFSSLLTLRDAQRTVWYTFPSNMIMTTLACSLGVVAFSYFTKIGCDPLDSGQISNPNQIVPFLVVKVLNYPGVPGIFMACIICGSLSNLSSTYSSLSALLWDDVLKDILASRSLTDLEKTLATKVLALVAGVIAILSGLLLAQFGGTYIQIAASIANIVFLPITILLILGATSRRTSWKSAIIAALLPSCLIAWMDIGSNLLGLPQKHLPTVTANCSLKLLEGNRTTPTAFDDSLITNTFVEDTPVISSSGSVLIMYKIFYMWYGLFGLIIGLCLGLILSFVPALKNTEDVDTKLLFPFVRRFISKKSKPRYDDDNGGTLPMISETGTHKMINVT